jgi:hypothetical protein
VIISRVKGVLIMKKEPRVARRAPGNGEDGAAVVARGSQRMMLLRLTGLAAIAIAALMPCCGSDTRSDESDAASPDGGDTEEPSDLSAVDSGLCGDKIWPDSAIVSGPIDVKALLGYSRISGDMEVKAAALTDLKGMESLRCVDLAFEVTNNEKLESFEGLNNLVRVGSLDFENNGSDYARDISALSKLREIFGDMYLDINFMPDLEGFQGLETVSGSVTLTDAALVGTLHGLRNLEWIGGSLTVQAFTLLENMDDLKGVRYLGTDLTIQDMRDLKRIGGLTKLTMIPGTVSINGAPSLENMVGMDNIEEIGGFLFMIGNGIASLDGLENLISVKGQIVLIRNKKLADVSGLCSLKNANEGFLIGQSALMDLHGLENLSTVGDLGLSDNPFLTSVDGLGGLEHITGDVNRIGGNPVLQDLDGLDGVVDMGGDAIIIVDNLSLPTCEATGFRDRMVANGWSGYACIKGNLPDGCPDDISGCSTL